jgi:Chaperone of endosialidase
VHGHDNTAIGYQALYNNDGWGNVGIGFNAGNSLTLGSGNVCIGYGILGVAGESNTTRIKNIYSSSASGRAVYVNSDNKIGTLVSSRRFKQEIKPMDQASEAILALKPVTFHYKKEIEPSGSIMFGLVAEDVEKADPDLVTRNEKGEAETVRYEAVNAMLLNEFLKEHRKVQELESTVAKQEASAVKQEASIARQQKQIEELTAGLQKVSAQLELNQHPTATVLNNH